MAIAVKPQRYILAGLVFVAVVYVALARQWISLSLRDESFSDYTTRMVQVAAADYRQPRELRVLLLVKAEQLELPLTNEAIEIAGIGRSLRVGVHYEDAIIIPVLNRPLYRMKFQHNFDSGSLQ